ncbi:protein complementing XP-C cells [Musa troglodytarum]|uniref:Protein complementing XP-C cells n=1 Tax=Musa troglodytarum TaxID=320322 RepID=A0A9E7KKZ5_9LILI|nr:protein complementing XP-C cells [Musa troglodytarum]URE22717.1 protein complementing XP-C cells [Musa troglodytarum]
MRTRNQYKRRAETPPAQNDSAVGTSSGAKSKRGKGSLTARLEETIVNTSKKAISHTAMGSKRRKESVPYHGEPEEKFLLSQVEESVGKHSGSIDTKDCGHEFNLKGCGTRNGKGSTLVKEADAEDISYDANELVWEEGTIPVPENLESYSHDVGREVTVEFTDSPSCSQKKLPRRISAKDKELAELVHKVHLLCLLARGRIVDNACNDSLIQASLLSLLPVNLLTIGEVQKLTANRLCALVNWFSNNFRVRSQSTDEGSFNANLAFALQTREGTAEEVAALSVALFRALNLTTRFVSILDVASLKPDADITGTTKQDTASMDMRIFSPSTSVLAPSPVSEITGVHLLNKNNENLEISGKDKFDEEQQGSGCKENLPEVSAAACSSNDPVSYTSTIGMCNNKFNCQDTKSKRKGDMELMLEMEMAISATAAAVADNKLHSEIDESPVSSARLASSAKKPTQRSAVDSSVSMHGSSGAVWSRRTGPPLYWAEVYCSGETLTGRWVHVDAANAIVDGAERVEAAAAACRRPLRYVVAFAGNGAKDVSRRYCMHWYKIASKRINAQWWEAVLAPLKKFESATAGSVVQLEELHGKASPDREKKVISSVEMNFRDNQVTSQSPLESPCDADGLGKKVSNLTKSMDLEALPNCLWIESRDSLEDMELATRALTEPLPTNQLAYKNHHLYAIEKWLMKYQVLYPKGPILGYCSGHPVYPRSCVQNLQTKQKWLREGLQVRASEMPAKVVKRSRYFVSGQTSEVDVPKEGYGKPSVELFGKWQLESLKLPHAVNGIVPKNERGQVEAWSEKCLPPGTTHLRLPRLVPVAKRLEIDFAPAMVGFDFRNGRCIPAFDGIVVCSEFKDAILEAYAEEEERRESEERKRNENHALSRWFQLLSSIITRQHLKNSYVDSSSTHGTVSNDQKSNRNVSQENSPHGNTSSASDFRDGSSQELKPVFPSDHDHEHVYPVENQSFDEKTLVWTKRCPCGFSIEVEEF